MAGENPSTAMASAEDWDQAEQASLARLRESGFSDPKSIADTKDRFNVWRQRNQHTKEQVKALTELFLDKKKFAHLIGTNVANIGNTAAQAHVGSQQKAQDGATSVVQLAAASDIELRKQEGGFGATIAGFLRPIGKMLMGSGYTGIGQTVLNLANWASPEPISTSHQVAELAKRQKGVTYDTEAPASTALSVLNAAMLMTEPDNIGMGADGGARVQQQVAAVTKANQNATPGSTPPAGASTTVSGTASTANIAAMTNDIIAFAKTKGGSITEAQASKQAHAAIGIDASSVGNNNGQLNTEAEVKAYGQSDALKSLPSGEQKIMQMFFEENLGKGSTPAPVQSGPVPAGMAYHKS